MSAQDNDIRITFNLNELVEIRAKLLSQGEDYSKEINKGEWLNADDIDEIAVDIGIGLRYDFKYFILRTDLGFIVRDPSERDKWKWRELNFSNSQFNIGLGYPF